MLSRRSMKGLVNAMMVLCCRLYRSVAVLVAFRHFKRLPTIRNGVTTRCVTVTAFLVLLISVSLPRVCVICRLHWTVQTWLSHVVVNVDSETGATHKSGAKPNAHSELPMSDSTLQTVSTPHY